MFISDSPQALIVVTNNSVWFGRGKQIENKVVYIKEARTVLDVVSRAEIIRLASEGPTKEDKIGHWVSAVLLYDVIEIIAASSNATDAWDIVN